MTVRRLAAPHRRALSGSRARYGFMSFGLDDDVGAGAEAWIASPPHAVARSMGSTTTLGSDDDDWPVSFVTLTTLNAATPRFAPLRFPLSGP